jgi:hypothetical protein
LRTLSSAKRECAKLTAIGQTRVQFYSELEVQFCILSFTFTLVDSISKLYMALNVDSEHRQEITANFVKSFHLQCSVVIVTSIKSASLLF